MYSEAGLLNVAAVVARPLAEPVEPVPARVVVAVVERLMVRIRCPPGSDTISRVFVESYAMPEGAEKEASVPTDESELPETPDPATVDT